MITKDKQWKLEIKNDNDAGNPFKEWDGLPWIFLKYNPSSGNNTEVSEYLRENIVDLEFLKNNKDVLINEFYIDVEHIDDEDEVIDTIYDSIDFDDIDDLEKLCIIANIPHYLGSSSGYSQGDYEEVLLLMNDKQKKDFNVQSDDEYEEIFKNNLELFGHYAWGDVYRFVLYKNVGRDEYDDADWENVESVGGFYGDDFENNGMLDYIGEETPDDIRKELQEWVKNADSSDVVYESRIRKYKREKKSDMITTIREFKEYKKHKKSTNS